MGHVYCAEFVPQVWINDYAVECDAEGERVWSIGEQTDERLRELLSDSYERDELRFHANAPQWVKDWAGPFEIYVYTK